MVIEKELQRSRMKTFVQIFSSSYLLKGFLWTKSLLPRSLQTVAGVRNIPCLHFYVVSLLMMCTLALEHTYKTGLLRLIITAAGRGII